MIDNAARTIYDYGQSPQRFTDSLRFDAEGVSARFIDFDGSPLQRDDITGSVLRISAEGAVPVDYKVAAGTDPDLLAISDINADSVYNPDLSGWYEYEQPGSIAKGSALDVSFILDAPAGKYGFVVREGETFIAKNDGREMEFWGTNVAGSDILGMGDKNYKEDAAKLADRIAASGFNLVRMHNLDGTVSHIKDIFGNVDPGWDSGWYEKSSGKSLDPGQMDKLCYFLNELKERGIYYWIDQTCYRRVFPDDEIESFGIEYRGLKGPTYYNRKIIDIQKEFTQMLLTYPNPYMNGRTLVEDPAMVMIGLNNESTLQVYNVKSNMDDPARTDDYYDELCQKFSEWLLKKYKSERAVKMKYGVRSADRYDWNLGLQSHEHLPSDAAPGYVEVFECVGDIYHNRGAYGAARNRDIEEFFADIIRGYLSERIEHLRGLGVQCSITGNTCFSGEQPPVFYDNTQTDFIDVHLYRAHPHGGWTLDTKGLYIDEAEKGSVLEDDRMGLFGELAQSRIYGYPYVISEWNICPNNRYIAEGLLLMSAYGSLGGWTPLQFSFTEDSRYFEKIEGGERLMLSNPFSGIGNPISSAGFPAAAVAFLRQDVAEAEVGCYNVIAESDIHIGMDGNRSIWPGYYYFPKTGYLGLVGRTGAAFDADGKSDGLENNTTMKASADAVYNGVGKKVYTSSTGELYANLSDGIFRMNTERSQAVCGFIGGQQMFLDSAEITVDNDYAALTITSLNDNAIEESARILLTALGSCQNYGQILSADGTAIVKGGRAPIMVEQITGQVALKLRNPQGCKVYALNSDGTRKAEVIASIADGEICFMLTEDLQAMNFEIVRE